MTYKIDEKETEPTYTITASQYLQLIKDYYFLGLKDKEDYFSKGFDKGFIHGLECKKKVYSNHEVS